ncbi:Protein Y9C9A.5 [Aphelenchoides avenae]|nr:Protein Y9C9A.5 [Aphelenchus avenae]
MGINHIHHYLGTTLDAWALVLNGLLLYLILYHSRFQIKAFKHIFLLTCIGDSLLSAVVLFGQPFNLFDGDYMFLVSNGYFSRRYPLLDHLAMVAFCSMLHINIVILAIQFIWRNNLICKEGRFLKLGKKWLVLPVLWCTFQLCTAIWCWVFDQEELREEGLSILRKNGWEFDNDNAPYPSLIPSTTWKTRLHHSFYLLSGDISYFVIISCQISVLKYIRRAGLPSHCSTSKAHAEVNRALVALAITPLMGIIPTGIMISSAALGIKNGPISAYMSIGMTVITLANPIVTIWFVRPYRDGLLHVLRIRRKAAIRPFNTTVVQGTLDPATQYPQRAETMLDTIA